MDFKDHTEDAPVMDPNELKEQKRKRAIMKEKMDDAYYEYEVGAWTKQHPNLNTPLLDRLHRPRSVFAPGHRLRMNIVPLFLNIFVPFGIFIITLGIMSFYLMYSKPRVGLALMAILVFLWLLTVLLAVERKRNDPEPSWYTYFATIFGLALLAAYLLGNNIYSNYSLPYYMVKDLKVLSNVNPMTEKGQNVMDGGIFYFNKGSGIDPMRTWHFKQGTVWCAAPIINGGWPAVPDTQSFDYWAVGKDCCSTSSSDFRCGAFNNPSAKGGVRVLDDADRPFYRLAVEQAASLYGIMANHPVFFEWVQDPVETVDSWIEKAFSDYIAYVGFFFLFCCFGVAVASSKYAWLGRAESIYSEDIVSDKDYAKGGPVEALDLHAHAHTV
jgi:hypothetical protein